MFITKAFVLAVLTTIHVAGAAAAPTPESENLVIIDTQDSPFGPLVIYGLSNATNTGAVEARAELEERACGSNDVTCGSGHVPNSQACSNLIASLNANGGTGLGTSPRSICQTTNGHQCGVSWANVAPGLFEGALIPAANTVYNVCVTHALSGLTRNTWLVFAPPSACQTARRAVREESEFASRKELS